MLMSLNFAIDIDECTADLDMHDCYNDSHCFNTQGSYECTCPSGYILDTYDGRTCQGIKCQFHPHCF